MDDIKFSFTPVPGQALDLNDCSFKFSLVERPPRTLTLNRTCTACPEQYEVFDGDRQIGYLRLRHGVFRADYPDAGGETVYVAEPIGDGTFEPEERERFLVAACESLLARDAREQADAPTVVKGE